MRPLSITVLPEDLRLVAEILAAVSRAHKALTGQHLTTAHMREEDLPPWGRVLVVYDEVPPLATSPMMRVECLEHRLPLPCRSCRADELAGPDAGGQPGRPTPMVLARARRLER